jgi:hypothetical protein
MARLEAPWVLMGACRRGEGEGGEQWGAVQGERCKGGSAWACMLFVSCSLRALPLLCVLWLAVREGEEKEEERRGKRKEKEGKEKRKRKNMEKIQT